MESGVLLSEIQLELEQSDNSRRQLSRTTAQVQGHLGTSFNLDILQFSYSDNPGEQHWSVTACRIVDKKKCVSIKFGREVPIKSDFLKNSLSLDDLSKVAHEYTHVVTSEYEYKNIDHTVYQMLQEGVAMAIEIKVLNSESLYNKVDVHDVIAHCGRLVQENKKILLDPKSEWNPDTKLEVDEIRELLMNNKLVYDGFSLKRGMIHIAGMYFVGSILGPRVDLAEELYKNPPTLEEIIEPNKYKDRVKIDLDQPIKNIQPHIPEINS